MACPAFSFILDVAPEVVLSQSGADAYSSRMPSLGMYRIITSFQESLAPAPNNHDIC